MKAENDNKRTKRKEIQFSEAEYAIVEQKANAARLSVAAFIREALENGVDSIEHGAKMDDAMIELFKERGAFLCTTISPALPYALFDRSITNATEIEQYNGNIHIEFIILN